MNSLKETIQKLSKLVQEDSLNKEHHFDQKQQEIFSIDQKLSHKLELEISVNEKSNFNIK